MLGSKNMLGKAIKYIIEQEKAIKIKVWIVAKKLHPHPKPQIQGMEPRRGRLGARTLPCDCGENRRIKSVWWCLDVFGREIRERRVRICLGNAQKIFLFFFFFCKMRGLGAFIVGFWPFGFWQPLSGHWPPLLTLSILAFSSPSLDEYLKVFLGSDWADFGVPRKLWMSSF